MGETSFTKVSPLGGGGGGGALVAVSVNVNGEPWRGALAFAAEAITVLGPAVAPTLSTVRAKPLASVVALAEESDPPPDVTANATLTPVRGIPSDAVTRTTSGLETAVPTSACCPSPDAFAIWAGAFVELGPDPVDAVAAEDGKEPPPPKPPHPASAMATPVRARCAFRVLPCMSMTSPRAMP
jgi:hypothetical protein